MQHQMTMMTMQPAHSISIMQPHPQQMPLGGSMVPNMQGHTHVVDCAGAAVVVHAFPVATQQQQPPMMTRQGP